jgi:hypothetical protein
MEVPLRFYVNYINKNIKQINKNLPVINVRNYFKCPRLAMHFYKILVYPRYEVVLESALDDLME